MKLYNSYILFHTEISTDDDGMMPSSQLCSGDLACCLQATQCHYKTIAWTDCAVLSSRWSCLCVADRRFSDQELQGRTSPSTAWISCTLIVFPSGIAIINKRAQTTCKWLMAGGVCQWAKAVVWPSQNAPLSRGGGRTKETRPHHGQKTAGTLGGMEWSGRLVLD